MRPTLAFLALALAACGAEVVEEETPLRPVRYQQVAATGSSRVRTFSGSAQAGVASTLSFRVGGSVREVAAVVGQVVRPGRVLARLDPTDYQLQVQEAEAGLAQAEAAWRNAEAEYERIRALYENNNASKSQLDAARASAESGRAQVEAAENRLALARSQLGYTTLRAPEAGSIARVQVEVNENVSSGQEVMLLTSGSRPEVEVAVPEVLISEVRQGDRARVTFDALPGRSFAATVTEVGVAATRTATTFPVTVALEETEPAIRPGMAAEVALSFADEGGGQRILVPPVAVAEDREGRFVFVVEPGAGDLATARRLRVEVGELTEAGLEITAGLSGGELVVTAGVSRIADGQQVRLLEEPGAGA